VRARTVAAVVAIAMLAAACGNATTTADTTTTAAGTGTTGGPVTTAAANQDDVHVPVDAPGVTDTEIHVGSVTAQTNPLGGNYGELNNGIKAYFEMMNSEGGIYGRQLKLTSERDDAFANNQTEVQALLAQDDVFAAFIATLLFTGADTLAEAKIPSFGWNINAEWTGKSNLFGNAGALCIDCGGPGLPWLAKQIGATKVGVLAYSADQSKDCAKGIQASFQQYPVAEVAFVDDALGFGVPDLSLQVSEMKQRGVGLVATCMDLNGVFTLAKEMDKQGLDAVQSLPNGYDAKFMAANGKFFEGDYVSTLFTAFEQTPQNDQVKNFLDWMGKTGGTPSELSIVGWIAADQFVTGLRLAGPHFSQQGVIDALNNTTYDPDDLILPIDWHYRHNDPSQPGSAPPVACSSLVQMNDSKFVPAFSDYGPWNCFDLHQSTLPDKPLTLDEARAILAQGPM
jgi:ABC-type branched-subunit amino acid transport system substrate-binding protein